MPQKRWARLLQAAEAACSLSLLSHLLKQIVFWFLQLRVALPFIPGVGCPASPLTAWGWGYLWFISHIPAC